MDLPAKIEALKKGIAHQQKIASKSIWDYERYARCKAIASEKRKHLRDLKAIQKYLNALGIEPVSCAADKGESPARQGAPNPLTN